MNRYPAGAIHSRGREFPLSVDDGGIFRVDVGAKVISGTTREEVAAQVNDLTREAQATVEVPFCRLVGGRGEPYRVEYWVATGIHGGNRNLIIRPGVPGSMGKAQQDTRSSGGLELEPLDAGQAAELAALAQARDDAAQAYVAFFNRHKIKSLAALVKAGIAERTS